MSKEFTISYLTPGIPEPYARYIKERNAQVSRRLAGLNGSRFLGSVIEGSEVLSDQAYYVPAKPISKEKASAIGIQDVNDLFGGVVERPVHADKAVLHITPNKSSDTPDGYIRSFACDISDSVLPGFSVFTDDDAIVAFQLLQQSGEIVLAKDPSQSDADGQVRLTNHGELIRLLRSIPLETLSQKGLVFEIYVNDSVTHSVGQINVNGKIYSYFGQQTSIFHGGRNKYGGTKIKMFRGTIESIVSLTDDEKLRVALEQSVRVNNAFSVYSPVISRTNFDVVQGFNSKGEFVSGVTDQSFRLGGASPAEVIAASYLENNPQRNYVEAEVILQYDPNGESRKEDIEIFLDDPTLLIGARLLK